MTRSIAGSTVVALLLLVGCAPSAHTDMVSVLEQHLSAPVPQVGDDLNLCPRSTQPANPNIVFPRDDANHYPDKIADQTRSNFQPTTTYGQGGFESTFKFFHWEALPVGGGAPVRIHGYRAYIALFLPPIFPGTTDFGWYRLLLVNMVSTVDNKQHQYAYIAPGEFADQYLAGLPVGYDLGIGGPSEFLVIDAATFAPVANPQAVIGRATGAKGSNLKDVFASADGQFAFTETDNEIGRPSYPFNSGKAPVAFDPWSFYWTRSQLAGAGNLTYAGKKYNVVATTWEERQWPGFGLAPVFKWNWLSIQIKGCLDSRGNKTVCSQGGLAGIAGRTIAAFDIQKVFTGESAIHDWTEVGPVPTCEAAHLTNVADWTTTVVERKLSPRTTTVCPVPQDPTSCFVGRGNYARVVKLTSPSRGVDLTATAVVDDQETYLVSNFYPGSWEGAVDIIGTINGQKVWGDAYLEQFFQPLAVPAPPAP